MITADAAFPRLAPRLRGLFNTCQMSVITQLLHSCCRCHCFDGVLTCPLAWCWLPVKGSGSLPGACFPLFFVAHCGGGIRPKSMVEPKHSCGRRVGCFFFVLDPNSHICSSAPAGRSVDISVALKVCCEGMLDSVGITGEEV